MSGEEEKTERFKVDRMNGCIQFRVQPGTHTIFVDIDLMRKQAIADFVNELSVRYKKHSANDIANEDIALAIGYFEVPMSMIYGDDKDMQSITDFNDATLGAITRMKMIKAKESGPNV